MTYVAKHDAEKKRESYHVKHCRIDFFIVWRSISHHNFMEWPNKLIHLKVCRRIQSMISNFV